MADLGAGEECAHPPSPRPLNQNFFILMQFLGKIHQIIGWHPRLGNPGSTTINFKCFGLTMSDNWRVIYSRDPPVQRRPLPQLVRKNLPVKTSSSASSCCVILIPLHGWWNRLKTRKSFCMKTQRPRRILSVAFYFLQGVGAGLG